MPYQSYLLLYSRVWLLNPSTPPSYVLFSVGLTGPQGPQGESLGHSRLRTPPPPSLPPAFQHLANACPLVTLTFLISPHYPSENGSGPFTVSLEKHLRKEKYAQNNLESQVGRKEVSSCANSACLCPVPLQLRAQALHWPLSSPHPHWRGGVEAHLMQRGPVSLGNPGIKVCPIVGPMCTVTTTSPNS